MESQLKEVLERIPPLYLFALKVKRRTHWSRNWVVTPHTDCVIEGFPRSANSFALSAFEKANSSLSIATHTHSPAQVVQATRWNIPVMVCVRRPYDAVRGVLAFNWELNARAISSSQESRISSATVLAVFERWYFFHQRIRKCRSRYYLADFDRIISDFRGVSTEFVVWAGRGWSAWNPERVSAEKVMEGAFHIGPNALRERLKQEVEIAINSADVKPVLSRCEAVYRELMRH